MAKKKADFSVLTEQTGSMKPQAAADLGKTVFKGGQHVPADPEEIRERQISGKTQGRYGAKMPRMNMAFTLENFDFIKTMAAARSMNWTKYTNTIIKEYREAHAEIYEKAKAFKKEVEES